MRLLMTPTSPYARKARVVARELGVDVLEVAVDPHADDPVLLAVGPLGRVPVLDVPGLGPVLDSRVICRYLAERSGRDLRPAGDAGWRDQVLEATADGLLDSAVPVVMERRRPDGEQSEAAIERQFEKMARTLAVLPAPDAEPLTLGRIALGCALGYLDFRLPELLWRENRADLADVYAAWASRPSFVETMPS